MRASLKVGAQLDKSNQVVMVVLMEMGDQIKVENHPEKGEGPPNGFRKINGGGGGSDPSDDDGDGDGFTPPSSENTPPTRRRHRRLKFVYVLQGPPGPPGQVGQPSQVGRDGRDGQTPQLTKALEDALKTQKTSWDTTNLENSFDYFGRTMHEVLKAQQRTTQNLEEQFKRANETQEFQTEAMQDMANANFQMKFDHMFANVPMYDDSNPDTFDDWLYQIESLCEMSHRDVRIELMGRASAQVKCIIRSIPVEWEVARRELKRCLTEEKSRAHSAFKLVQIKQKPNENLRIFILRYQDLHASATGKTAAEDTDPTHIIRFLGMMTNSEIARKITQKGIPERMTLGQAFTRAIELEAGYQLSEGVSLARPTEIMQVQEVEKVDEIGLGQRRSKHVVCWQCGEKGHLQRDCPHKETDDHVESMDDPNAYAGRSEQIIRINQPITVATRDNIYKQMGSQRTKANIYKAGYRKTRAALQEQQKINAAITSTLAAQKATQAPAMQPTVAQTPVVQQQPVWASSQPAQIIQIPATPGPSAPVSVQSPQGNVRYIKLPPGVTKGTCNMRLTSLNNPRMTKVSTTSPAATVNVTRGRTNLQNNQIKQEPATPGVPNTPKTIPTTTMVRKGKGRGKQVSSVSVLDTVQDEGEYPIEMEGEEFEDSDSDATELYEILANMTEPEEEANLGVEPELDPPI